MIRAGVGYSHNNSTVEAIEQAVTTAMSNAKIAKADLVFVFATIDYASEYQQIFKGVKDISGYPKCLAQATNSKNRRTSI